MAITETTRFNGRTQDEVEKKYMQWHKDTGRRVHVIKMHPVERLDSGLPGPQSRSHDEEFMMLIEYEEQLRAEPPEPLKPAR
jgi:hypothetical protein